MRAAVKALCVKLWKLCGSPLFLSRGAAVIILYHRVLSADHPDGDDPIALPDRLFAEQLAALKRRFRMTGLAEILAMSPQERKEKGPCCAITFDDGWKDNYEVALPILKRLEIPATIFLCTGFVGTDKHFWWSVLDRCLKEYRRLDPERQAKAHESLRALRADIPAKEIFSNGDMTSWCKSLPNRDIELFLSAFTGSLGIRWEGRQALTIPEIHVMHSAGCSFGSHTKEHVILTVESDARAEREISESLQDLRRLMGDERFLFAYPNGDFAGRDAEFVRKAGYEAAVTVRPGIVPPVIVRPYALPRIDSCGKGSADSLLFSIFKCSLGSLFRGGEGCVAPL